MSGVWPWRCRLCAVAASFVVLVAGLCAAEETQVPLDRDGNLMQIDPAGEAQMGLFADYPGFQSARLWQASDTSYVLEIEYKPGGEVQRARVLMSAAEAQAFRARVSGAIAGQVVAVTPDRSGRTAFLLGTALMSLGYYGWVLPHALDIDDSKAYTATYMATSSAGFFVPLVLTRNRHVSDASATLSLYGATRGAVHGVFLDELLRGEYDDFRHAAGASLAMSLGEYAAGLMIADRTDMRAGTAEAISAGGDFGLAFGLGLVGIVDFENDRVDAATILGSSGAGLLGGYLLARRQNYTRGDAYFLRAAANLVAFDGFALTAAITHDDDDDDDLEGEELGTGALGGEILGIALGHYLLRGRDFSTGEGALVHVGQFAGGLFGAGMAFVTGCEDEGYAYWTAAGATGGFFLTYYLLEREARTPERESSLNLWLCPEGLLALAGRGGGRDGREAVPLARLQYRF